MGFKFTCPYCFKELEDSQVHFRSEKVNMGENTIIPEEYDDIDDFLNRYNGTDKAKLFEEYQDWEFFAAKQDRTYNQFWEKYNGTTEADPADVKLGIKAYQRPVINPSDAGHQHYLKKQQDGSYYIKDGQGWVTHIELADGVRCKRRICCHCHNPLPDNYGKNPVRFVTVIGITGAGKTVYLSQLLKGMGDNCAKVGMTAIDNSSGIGNFLEDNPVAVGEPLPGSTPVSRFQQPLFYEMISSGAEDGKIETKTLVLYDVAGEVFQSQKLVEAFAPFIEHADGMIALIDPMQFKVISGMSKGGKTLDGPSKVMHAIHNLMSEGDTSVKCKIPFAVCISKADTVEVQRVFNADLNNMLLHDVEAVRDGMGVSLPQFNARQYQPLERELFLFMQNNESVLATLMRNSYVRYDYFAFTALGCDVAEKEQENGGKYQCPVGPVIPKRIEEPLLWMLYALGYIGKNADLLNEICCPYCGDVNNSYERTEKIRKGFRKVEVNRCCNACGHQWYYSAGNEGSD